ncbi:hypothetical protein N8J89_00730 [Crossiella sp. CA-258035]|uniref:DUF6541 family protein n=1 Tax=Crossiella sp. CA-258035 TaxID=2981138 RepID=UPI0024BC2D8E|nr:DUF6541 family protein [Crossiella sp. CA-258035]WHT19653.1 hypothetical protein N8J89_00730 [Crossiella sp. CA-258035]
MLSLTGADIALVLGYALLLFGPGLAIAAAGGLRGWRLVAVAPLLTYGIGGAVGPIAKQFGLSWGPMTLLGAALVVFLLVLVIQLVTAWLRGRRPQRPETDPLPAWSRRAQWGVIGATAFAVLLGGLVILLGLKNLQAIHQDWDAVFHGAAVRFIADTGDGTPAALKAINNYNLDSFFYPNGYHLIAAAVYQLTGATVPAVLNAQLFLVPLFLTTGLVALLRSMRAPALLTAVTAALSAAFSAVPWDILWRGPLLPYATGLVLVPAFLVLLGQVLATRRICLLLLTAIAAVGLVALHPSAAFIAIGFVVFQVAQFWYRHRKEVLPGLLGLAGVGVLAAVIGLPHLLGALGAAGSDEPVNWASVGSPPAAIAELITLNHGSPFPQWFLVPFVLIGLAGIKRLRRFTWFLLGCAFFGFLTMLAFSYDHPIVSALTRPWWDDRFRLAAIATIGLILVAANGVLISRDWLLHQLRTRDRLTRLRVLAKPVVLLLVILSVVGVASRGFYLTRNATRMSWGWYNGKTVTPGEVVALQRIKPIVGPGHVVMNDPFDGSAWMRALAGLTPVFGHVVAPESYEALDQPRKLLLEKFNEFDTNAEVRKAAKQLKVEYVYVSAGFIRAGNRRANGLRGLDMVKSLEMVDDSPDDRLYRIKPGAYDR